MLVVAIVNRLFLLRGRQVADIIILQQTSSLLQATIDLIKQL
jgi:hypothetical protein